MSRRTFLTRSVRTAAGVGVGLGLVECGRMGLELLEQHRTWGDAGRSNSEFLARNPGDVQRLTLGASFAPEQWRWWTARGQDEALQALRLTVRELNIRQLRLGLRWNRSVNQQGEIDLQAYRPFLDYCASNDVDVCLNVGAIKTFRWPEDHVPRSLLELLPDLPAEGGTVLRGSPLAANALDYLERLFLRLHAAYGGPRSPIRMVQVENEPFYPLGRHRWRLSRQYLSDAALLTAEAFPEASILLTSAGRLNLDEVKDLFIGLLAADGRLAGRLVSGFDFHFKTPLRDSFPVIRYFDQLAYAAPFATSCEDHIRDSRAIGFKIEVTEGQAEPYGHLTEPGNSAKDFRYLLLRCLNRVFDPREPALLRIWGIEELTKKMIRGDLTDEHHQIIELIQAINDGTPTYERVG